MFASQWVSLPLLYFQSALMTGCSTPFFVHVTQTASLLSIGHVLDFRYTVSPALGSRGYRSQSLLATSVPP